MDFFKENKVKILYFYCHSKASVRWFVDPTFPMSAYKKIKTRNSVDIKVTDIDTVIEFACSLFGWRSVKKKNNNKNIAFILSRI